MPSRIEQLVHLARLLEQGKIDRFEYEALKEDLFHSEPPIGTESANPEPMTVAAAKIAAIRAQTLEAMGLSEVSLGQTIEGRVLLQGIDAFTKGVHAHSSRALGLDSGLRSLIESKPAFLLLPIYLGVIGTVDEIAGRYDNSQSPLEFRGFMAAYSLLAWDELLKNGVSFDPGQENKPWAIFDRLGVGDPVPVSGVAGDGTMPTETPQQESQPPAVTAPSVADVVTRVHQQMGLTALPVSLGLGVLQAIDGMTASGLIYNSGDGDGFKLVVGTIPKSLNKAQRKLLGYSFLNNYPVRAVEYVKALVVAAVETGAADYSSDFVNLIRSKSPGT